MNDSNITSSNSTLPLTNNEDIRRIIVFIFVAIVSLFPLLIIDITRKDADDDEDLQDLYYDEDDILHLKDTDGDDDDDDDDDEDEEEDEVPIVEHQMNEDQVRVVTEFINPCKINAFTQSFALPQPLMKHIAQQPTSPKAWIKLIQTCKHFFGLNPILVVSSLEATPNNSWVISNLSDQDLELQAADFESCKVWLMGSLLVYDDSYFQGTIGPKGYVKKMISSLIPHIYKPRLQSLDIDNQNLSFEDFQFLTKENAIRECDFRNTVIKYANGKVVPLEVLLEALPTLHKFSLDNTHKYITPKTSKNLLAFPKLKKFYKIKLMGLQNSLNPESFVQFLKNQKLQKIILHLMDFVSPDYTATFVAALKEYTQDQKSQQFINFVKIYHNDAFIFEYSFDMMF